MQKAKISRRGFASTAMSLAVGWLGCRRESRSRIGDSHSREAIRRMRYGVPLGSSPALGVSDAMVTVVVFSDFLCPTCWESAERVRKLWPSYQGVGRFVFKHRPRSLKPEDTGPALAAEAAHAQGHFWPMHDLLMRAHDRPPSRRDFIHHAETCKLKVDEFAQDLDSPKTLARVADDRALSERLPVPGTPCYFVNGRRSFAGPLQDTIASELGHARSVVQTGVPRASLYRHLTGGSATPVVAGKGYAGEKSSRDDCCLEEQ